MKNIAENIEFLALNGKHQLTNSKKVEKLEEKLLDFPQAECPVKHIFGAGIYIREVSISAGVFSIGHHQKCTHMNHMVEGKVIMLKEDGTTEIVKAPATFVSGPGRKIGFILEDMVWRNIYPTDETDIEILESVYLDKSTTWEADNFIKKQIDVMLAQPARDDFEKMLKDLCVSKEIVREQSENEGDQIPLPPGDYKIMVSDSHIEGKGLFATSKFINGESIAPASINGKRTPAGRFTNHSPDPNAKMVLKENGDIYLSAVKNISGCHGGELGEEITVDYRQSVQTVIKRGDLCRE